MEASNEEIEIGNSAESLLRVLNSQRELFHSQVDQLHDVVVTQRKLTGGNPLAQEMIGWVQEWFGILIRRARLASRVPVASMQWLNNRSPDLFHRCLKQVACQLRNNNINTSISINITPMWLQQNFHLNPLLQQLTTPNSSLKNSTLYPSWEPMGNMETTSDSVFESWSPDNSPNEEM